MSKLSLKGWIGVLLGKAAQTGIPAHAKAKGWHSGWGGVGSRLEHGCQGRDWHLSLPAGDTCGSTVHFDPGREGKGFGLRIAWERNFGLRNPGCVYPANLAGMTP